MTPQQILRKKPFSVPIPSVLPGGSVPLVGINAGVAVMPIDDVARELRTQSDFLREYNITSHAINHIKYYPNPLFLDAKSGKYMAKVRTRIAIGFQERIKTKRKTALLGNNVGMRLISGTPSERQTETLSFFREGWEEKNIEVAVSNSIESDYITADCAVCFYMKNGKLGWRSFSFMDGDVLYPHFDPFTGEKIQKNN